MTILERINNYLEVGGLFNPEMMKHDKVRDLLIDCRTELTTLRAQLKVKTEALDEIKRKLLPPKDCPFCTENEPCSNCYTLATVSGTVESVINRYAALTDSVVGR